MNTGYININLEPTRLKTLKALSDYLEGYMNFET